MVGHSDIYLFASICGGFAASILVQTRRRKRAKSDLIARFDILCLGAQRVKGRVTSFAMRNLFVVIDLFGKPLDDAQARPCHFRRSLSRGPASLEI